MTGKCEKVAVDADALYEVLQALVGPPHLIRELQALRNLHKHGFPNAIERLVEQYEARDKYPARTRDLVRMAVESMHSEVSDRDGPQVTMGLQTLRRFAQRIIADFLETTGQYVTNDASREAAIAEAVAARSGDSKASGV